MTTIHYKTSRYNGAPDPWVVERDFTLGNALVSLIKYELGFGGSVQELSATRIVVKTSFFGNYDIVEFSGAEDAMRPLLLGVGAYSEVRKSAHEALVFSTLEVLRLPGGGYRPLDVATLGPFLIGQAPVKLALLVAAGIEPTEAMLTHTTEDVAAVVQMALDDDARDAGLELLGAAI